MHYQPPYEARNFTTLYLASLPSSYTSFSLSISLGKAIELAFSCDITQVFFRGYKIQKADTHSGEYAKRSTEDKRLTFYLYWVACKRTGLRLLDAALSPSSSGIISCLHPISPFCTRPSPQGAPARATSSRSALS
ncbi:hypothetical protein GOP47_0014473 [Adiantum capillus-veneris]|uniref:Uncharacterized protein n=1 Tax=Adiantum capillus-veneris TaxID=13818 RepID=A0A9D4ULR1_ADICA|nr:hypothetical protein GOP47_0014473 [Adiantum capillus-veneris]